MSRVDDFWFWWTEWVLEYLQSLLPDFVAHWWITEDKAREVSLLIERIHNDIADRFIDDMRWDLIEPTQEGIQLWDILCSLLVTKESSIIWTENLADALSFINSWWNILLMG